MIVLAPCVEAIDEFSSIIIIISTAAAAATRRLDKKSVANPKYFKIT
jgi:hypothetical protein